MTAVCTTYYQHTDLNATSGALTHRYYVRDYLGSTRAVIDEEGNVLQSTAYYPSGVPLTPNSLTPQSIKLHTGKDFFDLQGAGWYDNQARYYDCLIPTFKSIDPLAEKYPWLSPYNHCANNPLKFVDRDGMRWLDQDEINDLATNITNKINSIENDIIKKQKKLVGLDSNSGKYSKLQAEITELNMRIDNLNQSLSDITLLANDNNLYDLYYSSRFSDGQHHVYQDGDVVMIQTSSDAHSIHEIVHIRQALMSGGLKFSKNGYLQNPGIYSSSGKRLGDISKNEVDAYKAQYSFDKSFPIFINSISDITVHSIGNLKDGNNKDIYPFIKSYSDIINSQNK